MNLDQIETKCFILALFKRDDGQRFLLGSGMYEFDKGLEHFAANSFSNDIVEVQGNDGVMLAGQVRRAKDQKFSGYIGDSTIARSDIEVYRRNFFAFFRKNHYYTVIYIFQDGTAIQRRRGFIADAPEVEEMFQLFPEYSVSLNFEDVNYYKYAEDSDGNEVYTKSANIPISHGVTEGGLVWDNLGVEWDAVGAEWEAGSGGGLDLYHIMMLYFFMLKVLGYKRVVISHEWGPTIKNERKFKYYSHCIFARTFGWFAEGILPISEYIIRKIEHFKKPYFKLPIMADFKEEYEYTPKTENNFVYCASVYYTRIIKMVINAYAIYRDNGGEMKLTMILNGPENYKQDIAKYIEEKGLEESIIIKSKLPYKDLINEYLNAKALLIPLDPDYEQDEARFSQKIAEYLSSKSPIITNNVGEIKYYFNNDEIIRCDFNEEGFAEAFAWVSQNIEKAKEIGLKGYERGLKEFDYRNLGKGMYDFYNIL